MTPETAGRSGGGDFGFSVVGSTKITMINNKFDSSPTTDPDLDPSDDFGFHANIGLISQLDVYYQANLDGPGIGGLKFQFLGDPRNVAKQGNLSAAVFAGALWGRVSEDAVQGDTEANSVVKLVGREYGAAIGYRLGDPMLIYSNVHWSSMSADASLDQTASGTTTTDLVNVGGSGEFRTLAAGFRYGQSLYTQVEVAWTEATWDRTHPTGLSADDSQETLFGLMFGGSW